YIYHTVLYILSLHDALPIFYCCTCLKLGLESHGHSDMLWRADANLHGSITLGTIGVTLASYELLHSQAGTDASCVRSDSLIGRVRATAFRGRASSSRLPDRFLSSWNDLLGEDTNLAFFLSFPGGPEDECVQP